ncbi:hypothetical protein KPL71_024138 [Citrus sinensis]|uniref:Uncharacterized protein n=1 Tax=Citrus sinensis TaxID=2711 RepID=A0ACB8IP60_CITSI|nr:hypothetical protein KPL71_024138 [Citrus sinensis]
MPSGGCDERHSFLDANHTPNNLASLKGRVDDDLFQTLNNPLTQLDQHMLKAMISRANTVPKQNSDDNVTCRTMLTQISCSSIPTISPSTNAQCYCLDCILQKNDDTTKSNCKRLQPGGNPRPRPKDQRTIKHMLFLQSVTKHTCAFEVGSQSMVCPVAVEDLNSPRPLLVKLGKGVMEARNENIWACFVQ